MAITIPATLRLRERQDIEDLFCREPVPDLMRGLAQASRGLWLDTAHGHNIHEKLCRADGRAIWLFTMMHIVA